MSVNSPPSKALAFSARWYPQHPIPVPLQPLTNPDADAALVLYLYELARF
jgi:hypothetical protein